MENQNNYFLWENIALFFAMLRKSKLLIITMLFVLSGQYGIAQLSNIQVTGFNQDVVADGIGLPTATTTAAVDGTAVSNYVFITNTFGYTAGTICQTGTNTWPSTNSLSSTTTPGLTFLLQDPSVNNSLVIANTETGTLLLTNPVYATVLYVVSLSGSGSSTPSYTINFDDLSTQTGTITVPDWCSGSSPKVTSQQYARLARNSTSCNSSNCQYIYQQAININPANQAKAITSISFTNNTTGVFLNVLALGGNLLTPCVPPSTQPYLLTLSPGSSVLTGSFTPSSNADHYLIIRSSSPVLTSLPIDGNSYLAADILGDGTVVAYQTGTTFSDNGLLSNTPYYYFVFAANSNCISGPLYLTSSPLTNTTTTLSPLSGLFTIDNLSPSSGTNFNNFTDAFAAVNLLGISGPVTFDITSGQSWDIASGTNTFALKLIATGTQTNTITFQKSGTGANPILNITGGSGSSDAAIWLNGSDYITFNGIDIIGVGTALEYGFYLNGTASDGCNYNTIKNCKITLSNTSANKNPTGIYMPSSATALTGVNSYNKFYNNIISNAFYGYKFVGKTSYYDKQNEIGTENNGRSVIKNIGYAGSAIARGIDIAYQDSLQIFNTLIDTLKSTGGTYPQLCGIAMSSPLSNFTFYGDTVRQLSGNQDPIGINFNTSTGVNYVHHCLFTEFTATGGNINILRDEGSALGICYINDNEISNHTNSNGDMEGAYLNSASTFYVFNNNIHGFNNTSSAKVIDGIAIVNSGNISTVYNNYIYDLKSPASSSTVSTRAIKIAAGNVKLYYNTIYLDYTSTNSSNQSAGIYVSAIPASLDLRNNIVLNKCDMTIGTRAAAFWFSGTTYTSIASTSNNNLYYAGTPSAKNLIFYDGTNSDQTLADYKTRLAVVDQNSVTEYPPFINTVSPYNLHLQTTVATLTEGLGQPIASFDTDFDADIRFGSTGYTGGSTTGSDIGADEFTGTSVVSCTGTPAAANINGATAVCINSGSSLTLSTTYTDLGITHQWAFSITSGGPYTSLGNSIGQATGNLIVPTYYIDTIRCINSGLFYITAEKMVGINALPIVGVTPTTALFCSPAGSPSTLTASGAVSYAWSPTTGLSTTTATTVNATPSTTTVYNVTGTDINGCINTASATVTVGASFSAIATATPADICMNGTSTLTVTASGTSTYCTPAMSSVSASGDYLKDFAFADITNNGTNDASNDYTYYSALTAHVIADGVTPYNVSCMSGGTSSTYAQQFRIWIDFNKNGIFEASESVFNTTASTYSPNLSTGTVIIPTTAYNGITRMRVFAKYSSTPLATDVCIVSGSYGEFEDYNISITGGLEAFVYSWSPATFLNSTTLPSVSASTVTSTTVYSVNLVSGIGCSSIGTVTLTVSSGPSITTQPAPIATCAGSNATITVVATGPGLTYQWRKGGIDIPIAGNASAGTSTLILTAVSALDMANYDVVISSTCGTPVTSIAVALTVNALPLVAVTPTAANYCTPYGTPISLTASNADSYAWSPSIGLNTTTSTTVTANPSISTSYTVTGTDVNGCTNTATANITVNYSVILSVNATPAILCASGNAQLITSANQSFTTPLVNTYAFASSTETYTPLSGGITSTASGDDGTQTSIPIGFDFNYNGNIFTAFGISTNGTIQLGSNATSYSNALASNENVIAPMWDDNNLSAGSISYLTAGSFPNRVLTVDWNNVSIGGSGGTSGSTNQFQVKLYESGNVIKMNYGSLNTTNSLTASIGISGLSGNYISVTPGAPGAGSTTTENTSIADVTNMPTGTTYTFTPSGMPLLTYAWSPSAFIAGQEAISNPIAAAVTSTTNYTLTVTGNLGCSATATATVTVNPPSVGGTASALATSVCSGTGTTLSLNGYTGNVQWQSSLDGSVWANIPGQTTATLLTGNLDVMTYYQAVVTSGICTPATSNIVMINVDPISVGGHISGTATVCSGNNTTVLTLTGNTGNVVKWQSTTEGTIWTDIANSTNALTASNLTASAYYRAVVQSGVCSSAYSDTALVTVNPLPVATITSFANPSVCGASDGSATISTATSYSWNTSPVQTTQTATGLAAGTYFVTISNGICSNSTSVTLSDPSAPIITLVSNDSTICAGTATIFTANGAGAGTYEFFVNGTSQGTASTTATFTTSTLANNSVVTVRGVTAGCTGNSTGITILVSPVSNGGVLGGAATVCSNANSTTLTLNSYNGNIVRWESSPNGSVWTPIVNSLNTYTANNITVTTHYRVVTQNGYCGEATSSDAIITVTPLPTANISYIGFPYCKSVAIAQAVTFTGTTGGTYTAIPAGLTIDASTGAVTPNTSTAGTYTVTYTIAAAGGCSVVTSTTPVTITTAPTATIAYTGTPFCKTITTAQAVTLTGTTGGAYSSSTGLTINTLTGAITPSTSTAGNYVVTYAIAAAGGCAAVSATTSVTITTAPTATIAYAGSPYCKSVTTAQTVTFTGTTGGSYTAIPAGLTIDASTGAITPSTATAGTYTVTYTIVAASGCAAVTATAPVIITAAPNATIAYTGTPFCKSITTAQVVTLTGTASGTYSSTTGLTINTSTGAITPSTSTAGNYVVTYTIAAAGGCSAVSATTSVMITTAPTATIAYAGSPYCKTVTTAQVVTFTGTTGGTYTSIPAGLTIDASTGAITPSTATAGTYTVTYTIAAASGCAAVTATAPVIITAAPTATIAYTGTPFCTTTTTPQAVTLTGTTGGIYSSTTGLTINASTGAITPNTCTAGAYTVTYTIAAAGGCLAVTATTPVTIIAAPTATIAYAGSPFCKTLTTAQAVTLTGTSGGVYSAGTGLTINASTGAITPNTCTAGTYTVTYAIAAAGGCSTVTITTSVTITAAPTASISYTGSPWCPSATAQTVTLTGTTGGTYSSTTGLSIVVGTGTITPATTIPGTYTVTYTIAAAGGCLAVTATTPLTISPLPAASAAITSVNNDSVSISENNVLYTVPVIANATSYVWSYSGTGAQFIPSASTTTDSVRISFSATATSGNLTVVGHNACGDGVVSVNYPIWVSSVGIGEIANSLSYQIYPNPTKGIITINIKGINSNLELKIINIQGKLIRTEKLTIDNQTYTQDIDLSANPKGIYFVKLINKNFTKVEKVVLQ